MINVREGKQIAKQTRNILNHCWVDVGPLSTTSAQHQYLVFAVRGMLDMLEYTGVMRSITP